MKATLTRSGADLWQSCRCFGILVGAVLAAVPLGAGAGVMLDQEYAPASPTLEAHNGLLYRAQTFTAAETGKLVQVEALMRGFGSSTFEIWPVALGEPLQIPTTPLFSGTLNFSTGNTIQFEPLDVSSAGINLQPGDMLALVQIGNSHTGSGSWFGTNFDGYSGGAGFTTITTATTGPWNDLDWDLGFRTYIDVIPEPAGIGLFVTAVGLLLGVRRSRQAPSCT